MSDSATSLNDGEINEGIFLIFLFELSAYALCVEPPLTGTAEQTLHVPVYFAVVGITVLASHIAKAISCKVGIDRHWIGGLVLMLGLWRWCTGGNRINSGAVLCWCLV